MPASALLYPFILGGRPSISDADLRFTAQIGGLSNVSLRVDPVPEPTSLLLLGTGLVFAARRRLPRVCLTRNSASP